MAEPNGLATISPLSSGIVSNEWNEARQKYVIENFCGGAPLPVAMAFIESCMRRGLSPEAKQAYLIKRRNKNPDTGRYEEVWTQQTAIDGFRTIAERSGKYAGSDEPVFEWGVDTLIRATVTVWKMVQGQRCPFSATAYWEEYNPNQGRWGKMPRTMLAKCAEALALRKAFPEDLSGLYSDAEMDQADVVEASHSIRPAVSDAPPSPPANRIAAGSPTPIRAGTPEKPGEANWGVFWPWAKSNGVNNEAEFQALTGRAIKGLTPDQAKEIVQAVFSTMADEALATDPNASESSSATDSREMRRIHAVGKDRDLDHDQIRAVARFHIPGLESLTDLSAGDLTRISGLIETASDDQLAAWQLDWVGMLESAASHDQLDEIATQMKRRGVSSTEHQYLKAAYNQRKIGLAQEARARQDADALAGVIDVPPSELPGMPADHGRRTA